MSKRNPILDHLEPRPVPPTATTTRRAVPVAPPFVPFPVDALPTSVADFVAAGAEVFGCDASMLALPALAACGGAIGVTHAIRLRRTWKEYPIVWAAVVAESGTLKSPAFKAATAPIWAAQDEWLVAFRDELRDWNRRDEMERSDRPVPRTLATTDSIIERAADLLQKNPRGILKLREELSAWFAGMTRYRHSGSDSTAWLELFQGGRLAIHRKTGQEQDTLVSNAAVSIAGTIQPRILRNCFSGENRESGMAARFLLCCPPTAQKRWREIDIDLDVETRYAEVIRRLANLSFADPTKQTPVVVPLSPEAQRAWVQFYDRFAAVQHLAEEEARARYAKLEAYCARFALIDHLAGVVSRGDEPSSVKWESIERAIHLTEWFAHEGGRVHQLLSESDEDRDARRLVEWIRRHCGMTTVKQLQQSNSRKYPDAAGAREALNALVMAKLGRWEKRPTKTPGRLVEVVVLDPVRPSDDSDDPASRSDARPPKGGFLRDSFESSESSEGRTPSTCRSRGGDRSPPSGESSDRSDETEEEYEMRLEREAIQGEPRLT